MGSRWLPFISIIAMVGFGIAITIYVNRAVEQSQRHWCGVVEAFDDSHQKTPPTSPLGKDIAREMAHLRQQFHCN